MRMCVFMCVCACLCAYVRVLCVCVCVCVCVCALTALVFPAVGAVIASAVLPMRVVLGTVAVVRLLVGLHAGR